jgi:hypothetical protein
MLTVADALSFAAEFRLPRVQDCRVLSPAKNRTHVQALVDHL